VAHLWPFFDLVVRTPAVVLTIPSDEQLLALADVIRDGIHDPAWMPFDDPPWTDEASPARERGWLERQWVARTAIRAEQWRLRFGVFSPSGEALGMQDLLASTFPSLRTVSSYSWLGQRHQGRGIGRAMRAAVLHLAFEGLGAARAESSAFLDNHGSSGVSRALGYQENGLEWGLRRGAPEPLQRFVLTADEWRRSSRPDCTIEGLDACLLLLGLAT
jgi:RimJ/RimL family protein N-acetyltransferase